MLVTSRTSYFVDCKSSTLLLFSSFVLYSFTGYAQNNFVVKFKLFTVLTSLQLCYAVSLFISFVIYLAPRSVLVCWIQHYHLT